MGQPSHGATLALTALSSIHEDLWDEERFLVRTPPGTAVGVDLSERHSVRESALGAFFDLSRGATERASSSLAAVIDCQYRAPGRPWDGTFMVSAEDRIDVGKPAVEWSDYDPNWRQFIGCTLALIRAAFPGSLPPGLDRRLRESIAHAARSEPRERLPAWYTNPYLMQAWLAGVVAGDLGDADLRSEAAARLSTVEERFARYGDVDEYNSPTYDGVDLFALALWIAFPPTPRFEAVGRKMATSMGRRISTLFHPGLSALCGPYIRAYGLGLDRYVSLLGEWLLLATEPPGKVLPDPIDSGTDHVHDLYFLPLFQELSSVVSPYLEPSEVERTRRHVQRFGPVTATSELRSDRALGVESGRVPRFSRGQHVPVTVHVAGTQGGEFLGLQCGDTAEALDAELGDDADPVGGPCITFRVRALPGEPVSVRLQTSSPVRSEGHGLAGGRIRVEFSVAPASVRSRPSGSRGHSSVVAWPGSEVNGAITVE